VRRTRTRTRSVVRCWKSRVREVGLWGRREEAGWRVLGLLSEKEWQVDMGRWALKVQTQRGPAWMVYWGMTIPQVRSRGRIRGWV